ncbi:TRM11 family SAM-dependent methyltransferase [Peribacillus huizhouensis]|uniref:tRNA G10 N-methylase Trm11 n=1 Tax=Peribacillus huizhouensis TaxID=1501239 RepID=A0ABR6CR08_9BACI|nr:RNA methyltransferase [Peribacillus huizhouensis]MBA9027466.1 tRNA G10 N-methylase Trm11 [Peribacillus huizhouensis]
MNKHKRMPAFIYTYACRMDERALCQMEMRSLFGIETKMNILKTDVKVNPSRSPFIKERIEVLFEGNDLSEILDQVQSIELYESTFKVNFVKINDLDKSEKIEYKERRSIERELGLRINGEFDFYQPDYEYGIVTMAGRWYFGNYRKSESIWFHHQKKPHEYSTALSTRVARAITNIAIPNPDGVQAIDPCCGIGTVLVEALSMGIDIVGRDINPQIIEGINENLRYFGFEGDVSCGPISEISEYYDVAIIDLPYNLYTHTTLENQLSILKHARRIARKVVVISIETIDQMIEDTGLEIIDRCIAKKGLFSRQILVCE